MKTTSSLALYTTLALAFASPSLAAQERVGSPSPAAADTIDITFPGGSLTDFLAVLQKAYTGRSAHGKRLNLLVAGPTEKVRVPACELRDVYVSDALDSIERITRDESLRFEFHMKAPRSSNVAAIYTVRVEERKARRATRTKPLVRTQVFSTRRLTATIPGTSSAPYTLDAVLGAIESALEVHAGDAEVEGRKIRHHSASGLLFVRSTPDEIMLVEEVLGTMHRDLEQMTRSGHKRAKAAGAPDEPLSPASKKQSTPAPRRRGTR